jgi:hypothetical protein
MLAITTQLFPLELTHCVVAGTTNARRGSTHGPSALDEKVAVSEHLCPAVELHRAVRAVANVATHVVPARTIIAAEAVGIAIVGV